VDLWHGFPTIQRFVRRERRAYEVYLRRQLASIGFGLRHKEYVSSARGPNWSACQLIRGKVAPRSVSGMPDQDLLRILSRHFTQHELASLAMRGLASD